MFPIFDARLRAAFAAVLLATTCAGSAANDGPDRDPRAGEGLTAERAAATITSAEMLERISILAADSMGGRDTPSPGLESAAAYLASEFRSFGLEPGADGSFLQRYPLPVRALDTTSVHVGTVAQGENRMLAYGRDFFALPAANRPGVDMFHGTFAWIGRAGEGELPPGDWEGRIVLASLPGIPNREWQGRAAAAREAAQEAGATALFLVLDPEFPADAIRRFADAAERPRRSLVDPAEIPVFYLTRAAAEEIAAREGMRLGALPETPAEPVVFENARAHFSAVAQVVEDANPPNVVALLPGGDPALEETYVVLSAHMDHVGVGAADATGDSIYNGADDDASGTAALLEVAQAFAELEERPARSLLFLAVSGEEKGLLGSRWFSEHPTVPIESIVANLNIDMIARNARDSIAVIGLEYSSLGPLSRQIAAEHPELGLEVVPDPWPHERFFFRSDHYNFARKEIPAVFFFAGVHEDYHRPSDEVEKIDSDKAARVSRLIFHTAHAIASSPAPPRWTVEGLAEVRALTR